jgi:hypothetical protein
MVLSLMLARGMFMSANSIVRVPLASLTAFFESQGETDVAARIDAAIAANPDVFGMEEVGGETFLVTTREGRVPAITPLPVQHTFAARFLAPRPKPEQSTSAKPRQRPEPVVDVLAAIEMTPPPVEVEAPVEEVPEPLVAEEPVQIVAVAPPAPVAKSSDVSRADDNHLAQAIRDRLSGDPRVAYFGDQWLMEDRVPRFSRGDSRRLREYMQEKEQPLTDEDLAQDVLGARPGSPDFDLMRFAVNYRLSNEHREFEFVGTTNQRFWSTSGLPQIGTTRRKLNEIGSDYRFLLDETPGQPAYRTRESVDHTLTFYEYIHGLLPYDQAMQELLAGPLTPNQKSAVLTFECPQSFTTYLVELRFPTPNRGGFILGLDDFYSENLIPAAIISIHRTENDGHFRVEFIPESPRSASLLELDERRAQRYVFRPTTFACGTEDRLLLDEASFGGLANEKPLDERLRRRPESVVAATFERIGEERGGNYSLGFETLLAGVNIERPISEPLLRSILEEDDTGAFSRDPEARDSYTYVPGTNS